ncbi:type II toxin-antitoxin system HicB family antitoxin [Candidatus Poriferisodalis sp.]|uniref:type II toxin-antitoxin system HicB family antitoxin n=1 Tax=Candidatus Poriferisodalis sp. TaxID=3101277 RepID=UPI003B02E3A6
MEREHVVIWAEAATKRASLREIEDPAGVVATVAGLDGVWAQGADAPAARAELLEVLIDWAALKIEHGDDDIPSIDGVSLYATR